VHHGVVAEGHFPRENALLNVPEKAAVFEEGSAIFTGFGWRSENGVSPLFVSEVVSRNENIRLSSIKWR
jgi:hypothetical protein